MFIDVLGLKRIKRFIYGPKTIMFFAWHMHAIIVFALKELFCLAKSQQLDVVVFTIMHFAKNFKRHPAYIHI